MDRRDRRHRRRCHGGRRKLTFARVLRGLTASGAAADAALVEPSTDPFVSGGPGSLVPYDSLSREGRRFVAWRVPQAEITAAGLPDAQEPIRVFVGSRLPPRGRAGRLAMAELDRLGAWDKSAILVVPGGDRLRELGPVEALEFLTAGDCASVAVQYGLLRRCSRSPRSTWRRSRSAP